MRKYKKQITAEGETFEIFRYAGISGGYVKHNEVFLYDIPNGTDTDEDVVNACLDLLKDSVELLDQGYERTQDTKKGWRDKYIQLPVQMIDGDIDTEGMTKEQIADLPRIQTGRRVKPEHIISFEKCCPSYLELKPENMNCVYVSLSSGEVFLATLTLEEFEKRMDAFYGE